ncbi:MAG TPA: hypothetical protein PLK16_12705, partial [Saprospiraceae bacterium]|nr:hypothetical protein [Saprospiraceae bacterium]
YLEGGRHAHPGKDKRTLSQPAAHDSILFKVQSERGCSIDRFNGVDIQYGSGDGYQCRFGTGAAVYGNGPVGQQPAEPVGLQGRILRKSTCADEQHRIFE